MMTDDERMEIDWITLEAERIGLHFRAHLYPDSFGNVCCYIMEKKLFPGRKYQGQPPSLAKHISIEGAKEFLRDYREAFPNGRKEP